MDNKVTIENSAMQVVIKDMGAEMISLVDKKSGKELLWQGNPEYWNRTSPLLFPNVGKQFNMRYKIGGQEYHTNQHGFARDSLFSLKDKSDTEASFLLKSTASTKDVFPFDFNLLVKYTLKENSVVISWEVKNTGDTAMYFTIGGHPGFNTPPEKSDYCLCFPGKTELSYKLLNTDNGCVKPESYILSLKNHKLHLENSLFDNDALIFDDYQIEECILEKEDGTAILALYSPDFPNYGIWSKEDAPFICLEPWVGRADDDGFSEDISKKPGIISLEPGCIFKKSYSIEIL